MPSLGHTFNTTEQSRIIDFIHRWPLQHVEPLDAITWRRLLVNSGKSSAGDGSLTSFGIESFEDFVLILGIDLEQHDNNFQESLLRIYERELYTPEQLPADFDGSWSDLFGQDLLDEQQYYLDHQPEIQPENEFYEQGGKLKRKKRKSVKKTKKRRRKTYRRR